VSGLFDGGLTGRLSALALLWGSQSWLQPACPALDEFLGLPVTIPAGHEAEETLRSPMLRVCEPPERRLHARLPGTIARHDCLPHKAVARISRTAKAERRISQSSLRVVSETRSRRNTRELPEWSVGLKGRLQARLPAARRAKAEWAT